MRTNQTTEILCMLILGTFLAGCNSSSQTVRIVEDQKQNQTANTLNQTKPNAEQTQQASQEQLNPVVDQDYLFALRTVDEFCIAWLNRDKDTGLKLITDPVKKELGPDGLFSLFVGLSNPHHQSFEVSNGKRIDSNTMQFQIWFYESYTDEKVTPTIHSKPLLIDAERVSDDQWLISSLPHS